MMLDFWGKSPVSRQSNTQDQASQIIYQWEASFGKSQETFLFVFFFFLISCCKRSQLSPGVAAFESLTQATAGCTSPRPTPASAGVL